MEKREERLEDHYMQIERLMFDKLLIFVSLNLIKCIINIYLLQYVIFIIIIALLIILKGG